MCYLLQRPWKHTYGYKKICYHGNSLFPSPHPLAFNMLVIFSLKTVKRGYKLELAYLYSSWIRSPLRGIISINKIECQSWPENPLILRRVGTQYVAMVTKPLSSYCGVHLLESYRKESNISDKNWLRSLFSS